jgi:hypothetical protein
MKAKYPPMSPKTPVARTAITSDCQYVVRRTVLGAGTSCGCTDASLLLIVLLTLPTWGVIYVCLAVEPVGYMRQGFAPYNSELKTGYLTRCPPSLSARVYLFRHSCNQLGLQSYLIFTNCTLLWFR